MIGELYQKVLENELGRARYWGVTQELEPLEMRYKGDPCNEVI